MVFESAHVSTTIDRPMSDVYEFASDPRNLTAWATGLAEGTVEHIDGAWAIDSPMGRVTVTFAPPNPFGVLDHDVTLPFGDIVHNPMRVSANADGCDVVFTVHRRDGVGEADFVADTETVARDLAALRALLERR
ncbi:MAG: SRPBCC family protein [Ilumatobacteraceae bacterium]